MREWITGNNKKLLALRAARVMDLAAERAKLQWRILGAGFYLVLSGIPILFLVPTILTLKRQDVLFTAHTWNFPVERVRKCVLPCIIALTLHLIFFVWNLIQMRQLCKKLGEFVAVQHQPVEYEDYDEEEFGEEISLLLRKRR